MIILITGQPGNGKTLRAISLMREEYERNKAGVEQGKERPRDFYTNVAGASRDENPNAFPWVQRMPEHNDWTKLPDGSYVLIDEAHADGKTVGLERYGTLFPATGKPGESEDPRVRSMSTHRHRGIDLLLVTQFPTKIHHQVRTLVGKHLHMNRALGLQRAGVLTWTRTQVDVYDEQQREKAEEEIWAYPADLYDKYKSATLHTATYKFKVPARVWGGLAQLITLGVVCWMLWLFVFKPDSKPEGEGEQVDTHVAAQAEAPSGAPGPQASAPGVDAYLTALEPRVPSQPWSAPLYDEREAVSKPELYCMSAEAGDGADGFRREKQSCTCITEQGTVYKIRNVDCRAVARWGPSYNPYKEPRENQQSTQLQPQEVAADEVESLPGQVVGYKPGMRGDVFPRSPAYEAGGTYTGPTSGL